MANTPNDDDLAIERWPEVSLRTGFKSKSHVEQLEKRGLFPQSIKIGLRAKGWVHSEITAWIEERIAESRGQAEDCRDRSAPMAA